MPLLIEVPDVVQAARDGDMVELQLQLSHESCDFEVQDNVSVLSPRGPTLLSSACASFSPPYDRATGRLERAPRGGQQWTHRRDAASDHDRRRRQRSQRGDTS